MLLKILRPLFTNIHDKLVFVHCMPFQPSLMFAIRAGAYPSGAPVRCSTLM